MSWLPQSLRTFDGEPVTAADAARPDVRLALMRRHRNTLMAAMFSLPPTLVMLVALLWNRTDRAGLMSFALLVAAMSTCHWLLHLRLPLERVTIPRLFIAHVGAGIAWGSLTVIAMPPTPEWQAVAGTITIAVLASGFVFVSQFGLPFAGWVVAIMGTSSIGFLRLDNSLGYSLALVNLLAVLFALLLGAVLRAGDLGASAYAARNADLVSELQAEKRHLRELTRTDPLTAIGNRLAFTDDLDDALRTAPHSIAVALLDLDDFKRINDTLGHHAGDEVLQLVTQRLTHVLQPGETLYRLGGDELMVLQVRSSSHGALREFGDRLIASFNEPLTVGLRPVSIRASIGIAESKRGADPEEVQRGADEALYRAKRSTDTEVEYFDAAMQIEAQRRASQRKSVSAALRQGEIVSWLQPVIELKSGAIVGAEMLARWEHPEGVRSAATFIEAIEESGLATLHNMMVFASACTFREELAKVHGEEFFVSFNVSPAYLHHFVEEFEATGELDGFVIEITEQRDLANHQQLSRLIARAQAAGARVAVDDFGTGFSSMERLRLGSFDGLKIDGRYVQSLIEGPNDAAIVASIAEIGRHMRIPIVAEGIETQHHANRLRDFGIQWGQGYLYSPAVPFEQLTEMVSQQRARGPYFSHLTATKTTEHAPRSATPRLRDPIERNPASRS